MKNHSNGQSEQIKIKPMLLRHLIAVAAIEDRCFGSPWPLSAFLSDIINPNNFYRVALAGSKVVGYIGMQIVLDEGYITKVAVAPEMRGRGIGDLLLSAVRERSDLAGEEISFITLEVRVSNAVAKHLYEKYGFIRIGVRKSYYREPPEDADLYSLYLRGDPPPEHMVDLSPKNP